MQVIRISYGVKGFASLYSDALKWSHMLQDKTKLKAQALAFWEKHGLRAALDAFPYKRSTLFEWKKKLRDNQGRLESLNEKSRRTKT